MDCQIEKSQFRDFFCKDYKSPDLCIRYQKQIFFKFQSQEERGASAKNRRHTVGITPRHAVPGGTHGTIHLARSRSSLDAPLRPLAVLTLIPSPSERACCELPGPRAVAQ